MLVAIFVARAALLLMMRGSAAAIHTHVVEEARVGHAHRARCLRHRGRVRRHRGWLRFAILKRLVLAVDVADEHRLALVFTLAGTPRTSRVLDQARSSGEHVLRRLVSTFLELFTQEGYIAPRLWRLNQSVVQLVQGHLEANASVAVPLLLKSRLALQLRRAEILLNLTCLVGHVRSTRVHVLLHGEGFVAADQSNLLRSKQALEH